MPPASLSPTPLHPGAATGVVGCRGWPAPGGGISLPPLSLAGPPGGDGTASWQPVVDGGTGRDGTWLLVEAYAVLWLLVFAFVAWTVRRQSRLNERIGRLERELASRGDADREAGADPRPPGETGARPTRP